MLYSEERQEDQRRFNLVKLEEWDTSFSKKRKNIIESRQSLFYIKKKKIKRKWKYQRLVEELVKNVRIDRFYFFQKTKDGKTENQKLSNWWVNKKEKKKMK